MQVQTASEITVNKRKIANAKKKENPLLKMIGAGRGMSSHGSLKEIDSFIRSERDKWE